MIVWVLLWVVVAIVTVCVVSSSVTVVSASTSEEVVDCASVLEDTIGKVVLLTVVVAIFVIPSDCVDRTAGTVVRSLEDSE